MGTVEGEPRDRPTGLGRRFLYELLWAWLSNIVALFVAAAIFSGVSYGDDFWVLVVAGLVFGLVNVFVRPLVLFLALPAVILTLGLALLLVNAFMLWLTDADRAELRGLGLLDGRRRWCHRRARQLAPCSAPPA